MPVASVIIPNWHKFHTNHLLTGSKGRDLSDKAMTKPQSKWTAFYQSESTDIKQKALGWKHAAVTDILKTQHRSYVHIAVMNI